MFSIILNECKWQPWSSRINFGDIQNLQRSPIPQTSTWSGTFSATWSNKPALTKSVKWVHSFSVGNANTKECYQKIFWNWPQNWQRNCTKNFSWNFHCPHESTQFWCNIHFDRLTTIGNLVFLRLPWGSSSWPRGGNNNCKQTLLCRKQ